MPDNPVPDAEPRDLTRRQFERSAELASLPNPRAQHWARVHEKTAEAAVQATLEGLRG